MLIFHSDTSPFPKPALKKGGTAAPSTPQDVILGVQSHQGARWMSPRVHPGAGRWWQRQVCTPLSAQTPFSRCSHVAQARGAAGRTASAGDLLAVPREPPITVCCRTAAASPPHPAATGDEAAWSHGCLAGAMMCRILHPLPPSLAAAQRFGKARRRRLKCDPRHAAPQNLL